MTLRIVGDEGPTSWLRPPKDHIDLVLLLRNAALVVLAVRAVRGAHPSVATRGTPAVV
jgi:hypothetical protein